MAVPLAILAVQLGLSAWLARLRIDYQLNDETHVITLAPLPHPSPANAKWFSRFPALMDARLRWLS